MFTQERLENTLIRLGAMPDPSLFRQLEERYRGTGRYYHTDQHVAECLSALDAHLHLADHPAAVEIALWFHDAVYDPRRSDNEEQSSELARQVLLSAGADRSAIEQIESMILATRTHAAQGRDAELMLDIDLAILGQPPSVFSRYDEAIRKEYAWVPQPQYRSGRAKILSGFLDRPRIYHTADFRDAFELQARSNLQQRVSELVG